jgi:hypothetical protein
LLNTSFFEKEVKTPSDSQSGLPKKTLNSLNSYKRKPIYFSNPVHKYQKVGIFLIVCNNTRGGIALAYREVCGG